MSRLYQPTAPVYRELSYVLTPNQVINLNFVGDTIQFIEVSGTLDIRIDDSEASLVRQGVGYRMPENPLVPGQRLQFSRLQVIETGGEAATLTIAIAKGDIRDTRFSTTADTPIKNAAAPNESILANLLATDAGLVALAAAINGGLQADNALRPRWTDLTGASHHQQFFVGTTTLVTAAANVNGVLILSANFAAKEPSAGGYVGESSSKIVCGTYNGTAATGTSLAVMHVKNILFPAGLDLKCGLAGNNGVVDVWYKVL